MTVARISMRMRRAVRLHQEYGLRASTSTVGPQSDLNGYSVGDDVQSDSLVSSINNCFSWLDQRNRFE